MTTNQLTKSGQKDVRVGGVGGGGVWNIRWYIIVSSQLFYHIDINSKVLSILCLSVISLLLSWQWLGGKRHRKSELHNLRSLNLSHFHDHLIKVSYRLVYNYLITCQFIIKCSNYCLRILLISTYSCKCNGLEANAIRTIFVCPLPFFISKFENYCNFSVFSNLVYLRLPGKWHPILITYGPQRLFLEVCMLFAILQDPRP